MPRLRPVKSEVEAPVVDADYKLGIKPKDEKKDLAEAAKTILQAVNTGDLKTEEKQPEIEVVEPPSAPEPEPVVEAAEPEPDDQLALKNQLEELRRSQEALQQRNEELTKREQERVAAEFKYHKDIRQSQLEHIATALEAAQRDSEAAKRDYRNAVNNGDVEAQIEASERMTDARYKISTFQSGKSALEEELKAITNAPQPQPIDKVDTWNLPPQTAKVVKEHRHWISTPQNETKLRFYADRATEAGLVQHSKEWLDFITNHMEGTVPPATPTAQPAPPVQKTPSTPVSAPVSRSAISTDGKRPGKTTLTAAEVEAARVAGVTLEQYAEQKLRLQQMKANGEYGEQR